MVGEWAVRSGSKWITAPVLLDIKLVMDVISSWYSVHLALVQETDTRWILYEYGKERMVFNAVH